MTIRIRLAGSRDVAWLLHIDQQSGCPTVPEPHLRDLVAQVRAVPPVYVAAVACRGKDRLGYILYDAYPGSETGVPVCHIWRLAVTPAARRAGIGSGLVRHAALQHPKAALQLFISERDVAAQLFLKRCGFRLKLVHQARAIDPTVAVPPDVYVFGRDPA